MQIGKKNESIILIDILFGGDHGKRAFREIININAKFTSGRNVTRIFSLAYVQCKKYNGEIMGNTFMDPIGDRLNNICSGRFLGWTHEVKTQFVIMICGCTLPTPRGKTICSSLWLRFFVTGDLAFYVIVLGKEGSSPHWCLGCMLDPYK